MTMYLQYYMYAGAICAHNLETGALPVTIVDLARRGITVLVVSNNN